MRITLVGSRHFGVTTLNMLRGRGVEIARVVVHDGEDRLVGAAKKLPVCRIWLGKDHVHPLSNPFVVIKVS
jgi:hypothetical protein